MSTKYVIKKCHEFGFARSINDATAMYGDTLGESQLNIYLCDKDVRQKMFKQDKAEEDDLTSIMGLIVDEDESEDETQTEPSIEHEQDLCFIHSISELRHAIDKLNINIKDLQVHDKTSTKSKVRLFVDLGYQTTVIDKIPVEADDTETIKTFSTNKFEPSMLSDFTQALLQVLDNPNLYDDKKLSDQFVSYLYEIYGHLKDSRLKSVVLNILSNNNVQTHNLDEKYPFDYKDVERVAYVNADMFKDIDISVDEEDSNTSTKLYRADKDALKKATMGKSIQFEAFSENKFAVIHTKKTSGLESKVHGQNYDVLNTLAVNGVMLVPDTKEPLSMFLLMKELERLPDFDIIFIHPAYDNRSMKAEHPCEQVIPAYKLNGGEILAVAYKYLVNRFFGYCSIFSESMLELRYYI